MSQRTIKNYTSEDFIIKDLGNVVIPANGAIDLGGNESRLVELAGSEDLLKALSQGIDKFQLNDGLKDLSFSEGVDLIRKIQRPTEVDSLGRWVVRQDSRKKHYEIIFTGRGDRENPKAYGEGTWFKYDFSAPSSDPRWIQGPEGYKVQRIEWRFLDGVLLKEGALYYYNMPKGSYINFYLIFPAGAWFYNKIIDSNFDVSRTPVQLSEDTVASRWVNYYPIEGTCPMGDELNTESAQDTPSPNYARWFAEVVVPEVEGWEQAHGHWTLEIYRYSTIYRGE